jgi:aspartyl-tRNA synthetase
MPIVDVMAAFADALPPFVAEIPEADRALRGFIVPGGGAKSRKQLDDLVALGTSFGGRVAWARLVDGQVASSGLKAFGGGPLGRAYEAAGGRSGDLFLFMGGAAPHVADVLGRLRVEVARREGRLNPDEFRFAWITEFPLLEWNPEDGRWQSMHHPFTSPHPDDVELLATAPGRVRARAYDLALNGSEIAGGSIRIHRADVQRDVFSLLGISDEEARARFGFFLDALEHGTPPHGGIAFGLDRMVALLCGEASIREVMAFPKTAQAVDLMAGAPSAVDARQLRELKIRADES